MNIANERWETIRDFPNYMISSESRVLRKDTLKIKAVCYNKRHRFRYVRLHNDERPQGINVPLYRLKAIAFIENPHNKREVNHKYGDRTDEDINALEWTTPKENMKHSFATGLGKGEFKNGFSHQFCKVTPDDVEMIKRFRTNKLLSLYKLSKVFGMTPDHICRIATGRFAHNV